MAYFFRRVLYFALVPRAVPPRSGNAGASPARQGVEANRFQSGVWVFSANAIGFRAGLPTGIRYSANVMH